MSEMNGSQKRKRCPNFTTREKVILVDIVGRSEVFSVVENSKTDGASQRQKSATWDNVSLIFNSEAGEVPRSADNLKGTWENLKKTAKRIAAKERQLAILTGGGAPAQQAMDPVLKKVLILLGSSAKGFYNRYDSDAEVFNIESLADTSTEKLPEVAVDSPNINDTQDLLNGDWSQASISILRTPICPILRVDEDVLEKEVSTCVEPEVVLERPPTPRRNLSSRRRPTLPKEVDVSKARVEALAAATAVSSKQLQLLEKQESYMKELFHQNVQFTLKMEELLSVKLEIEKEKLKREKLLTLQCEQNNK